jgi:hypothetical protein
MSVENNKKVATDDVLCIGPETLDKKLAYYASDAVVWDPVMRVAGYKDTNKACGQGEVRDFFTWLANLPPKSRSHGRFRRRQPGGRRVAAQGRRKRSILRDTVRQYLRIQRR